MPDSKKKSKPKDTENLYQRDGVWYVRLQREGENLRRSLHTTDVADARRQLKLIQAEREKTQKTIKQLAGGIMTWPVAIGRFMTEAEASLSVRTYQRYMVSIRQISAFFEECCLHEIDHGKVVDFIAWRREKSKVTNSTINRDLTALSQVLDYAVSIWKTSPDNPARSFNRKKATREIRKTRELPSAKQVEIVAAERVDLFGEVIRFAYLTGARQQEICTLKWARVKIKSMTFGCAELLVTKSKFRTIRLSPEAIALLVRLPKPEKGSVVFHHGLGEPFKGPSTMFARMTAALAKEDPDFCRFRFHDLRHAYAVNELRKGTDIYDLSRHMGHSSVKVTGGYLGYVAGGAPLNRRLLEDETQDAEFTVSDCVSSNVSEAAD